MDSELPEPPDGDSVTATELVSAPQKVTGDVDEVCRPIEDVRSCLRSALAGHADSEIANDFDLKTSLNGAPAPIRELAAACGSCD